jgi:VanZ family protein
VALGWTIVVAVFWLSLTPSPPHIDIESGDKLGHLLSYFLLMFWFAQLYARRAGYAAGFIAMGITLELLQGALGYRSFERYDILANCAGVLLGWAAAHLVGRRLLA